MVLTLQLPEDVCQITGIQSQFVLGEGFGIVDSTRKHFRQIRDERGHGGWQGRIQIAVEKHLDKNDMKQRYFADRVMVKDNWRQIMISL